MRAIPIPANSRHAKLTRTQTRARRGRRGGRQGPAGALRRHARRPRLPARDAPFRAVQSGKRIELEAWLQLLERPRDMNQELELFGYNAFSLACDLGHLDMVRHLLELCLDGDQRIDTSAVTFLGLTGWDLAKEYAAQLPEDQSRQEIAALLEEWSRKEHFGPDDPNKLREEAKRNLSRPDRASCLSSARRSHSCGSATGRAASWWRSRSLRERSAWSCGSPSGRRCATTRASCTSR